MVLPSDVSYRTLARHAPIDTAIIVAIPLFLAVAQLGNSVFTGLSFTVSIPFAVILTGFSTVIYRYRLAQFRRELLERDMGLPV